MRVPLDKSEVAVKSKSCPGRCASTAWFAREVEDQDSGNLTLNHPSVVDLLPKIVPPTIDSA